MYMTHSVSDSFKWSWKELNYFDSSATVTPSCILVQNSESIASQAQNSKFLSQ